MNPIHILRLEGSGFLTLLAAILIYRMLTRQISLAGLLGRKDMRAGVSPERVQLLVATITLCVKYVGEVLHSTDGRMPDVSPQWLYVFGSSSGIYASVKAIKTFRSKW
jgi:hypothetical protein